MHCLGKYEGIIVLLCNSQNKRQIASDIQTLEEVVQSLRGDTKSKFGASINADSEMVCIICQYLATRNIYQERKEDHFSLEPIGNISWLRFD